MDDSDREGLQSCRRIILLLIGCQLASQPKVELPHAFVAGVVSPHGCKYLTNIEEVFLDRLLLDRFPLHGQKAGTYAIGENLEERNGVINIFEVGNNLHPAVEVPPLAPGGNLFLEDSCGETLGACLLCSMLVRFRLHTNGRGSRHQVLLCWKCVRKWERNFRSGR